MLLMIFTLTMLLFVLANCGQKNKTGNTMTIEQRFLKWTEKINQTERIDSSIVAYNFGLFESTKGYIMYLIGSKSFDKEDEDWATNVDFEPKEKYFELGKEFSKDKDWQEVLKYSEKLIADFVNSNDFRNSIFGNAKAITTGFDDGNLTVIYLK
jgi:hypothetical protein